MRNSIFDDDPAAYEALREGWLFERRLRELTGLLDAARPDDVVLDLGAATGQLLRRLRATRPDLRYVGVEPLAGYVNHAAGGEDAIDIVQGAAEQLAGLGVGPVDWVLTNDVLHHVADLCGAVEGVTAVSRPWAQWIAMEPNPQNPWVRWYHSHTPGERIFDTAAFMEAVHSHGWRLLRRRHLFLVPQVLPRPPRVLTALERVFERLPVVSGGLLLHLVRQPVVRDPTVTS